MKNRPVLACLIAAAAAGAAHADTFTDNARVRSVEPQYESVQVPRNECTNQVVTETQQVAPASRNYGGVVIGGVAGALLGNQVGKGHGREAATAAGAVVGALAGDQIANNGQAQYQQVPREVTTCRTVNDVQTRLTGYRVVYDYHGRQYSTVMHEQPGPTVPVQVSVTPIEREYYRR